MTLSKEMSPIFDFIDPPQQPVQPLKEIRTMLIEETIEMSMPVINSTLRALGCARKYKIEHNNILTIIDYSLPSNKKRLWIFNLLTNELLFKTYVSHGIKSGTLSSTYFSNIVNSKTSSIGVYNTEKSYRGRHGLSLKLYGLDRGFNHNAYRRFIVMHGSWYMSDAFIKKYGRSGRSWGCPALPERLTKGIINTIKDKTLLVVYYPGKKWISKSKLLNCNSVAENIISQREPDVTREMIKEVEIRKKILFADINNNNRREEHEAIMVVNATKYKEIFEKKVPLNRMLRRQINKSEYIALTESEFEYIYAQRYQNNSQDVNHKAEGFSSIYFVIPNVRKERGYYATEMLIVNMGEMKRVILNGFNANKSRSAKSYTLYFEKRRPIKLRGTKRFIRWLGL